MKKIKNTPTIWDLYPEMEISALDRYIEMKEEESQ